jgi:hypothetical protein
MQGKRLRFQSGFVRERRSFDFPFEPDERFICRRHLFNCMSNLTCRQR